MKDLDKKNVQAKIHDRSAHPSFSSFYDSLCKTLFYREECNNDKSMSE